MNLLLILVTIGTTAQSIPIDAGHLAFSAPRIIAELDAGKLKGEPSRLAWSPDGSELYLQVTRSDRWGNTTVRHFTLPAAGGNLRSIEQPPPWAVAYWNWKSDRAAPGRPAVKIEIDSRQELVRATSAPRGGDLARGGVEGTGAPGTVSGTTVEDAASAAYQSQTVTTVTLRLKGEVIGEWKNEPVVPGLTFGWAPAGVGAIAFARRESRIVVMDLEGRKQELPESERSLLPAWSEDAGHIAYVHRGGKNKYALVMCDVNAR